jgi:hypothetical protein
MTRNYVYFGGRGEHLLLIERNPLVKKEASPYILYPPSVSGLLVALICMRYFGPFLTATSSPPRVTSLTTKTAKKEKGKVNDDV